MSTAKGTLKYARGLLRDESGFIGAIIGGLSLIAGLAGGLRSRKKARKEAREAAHRQESLMYQQMLNTENMELEEIREMKKLNESKIEAYKLSIEAKEAQSFQTGSISGPYFQVVNRR